MQLGKEERLCFSGRERGREGEGERERGREGEGELRIGLPGPCPTGVVYEISTTCLLISYTTTVGRGPGSPILSSFFMTSGGWTRASFIQPPLVMKIKRRRASGDAGPAGDEGEDGPPPGLLKKKEREWGG